MAVTLRDLSRPQWAAALHAARVLRESNASDAEDRARFCVARNRFVAMLPADAPVSDLIGEAVRWYAMNDIAAAFVGMPMEPVT